MWKAACLLLLAAFSFPVLPAEEPFLIYAQGVRQPRGLEQNGAEVKVLENNNALNDVTKILFGLDQPISGEDVEERKEKSLLNTFPFNQSEDHHEGHHEHEDHSGHHGHGHHDHEHHDNHNHDLTENRGVARSPLRPQLSNKNQGLGQSQPVATFPFAFSNREVQFRQKDEDDEEKEKEVSINTVVTKGIGEDGRKCIDKVMMVEETVYDEVITCDHSYDERCHTSYITNYESQQEEECEENFKKVCMINYEDLAYNPQWRSAEHLL